MHADTPSINNILNLLYYKKRDLIRSQCGSSHQYIEYVSLGASYSCGTSVQLPSALDSLTAVFDMGTGVASPPSPPDYWLNDIHSKPDRSIEKSERTL